MTKIKAKNQSKITLKNSINLWEKFRLKQGKTGADF